MKLRVHEIQDAGVLDMTATLPAELFSLDLPDHPTLAEPVKIELHGQAFDEEVLILGKVSAKLRFTCSRCLEPFITPLSAGFELHVPLSQTFADILEEVRQVLLLNLPPKPLCRAECRGLCPRCGKNQNQELCSCSAENPNTPFAKLKDFRIH